MANLNYISTNGKYFDVDCWWCWCWFWWLFIDDSFDIIHCICIWLCLCLCIQYMSISVNNQFDFSTIVAHQHFTYLYWLAVWLVMTGCMVGWKVSYLISSRLCNICVVKSNKNLLYPAYVSRGINSINRMRKLQLTWIITFTYYWLLLPLLVLSEFCLWFDSIEGLIVRYDIFRFIGLKLNLKREFQ